MRDEKEEEKEKKTKSIFRRKSSIFAYFLVYTLSLCVSLPGHSAAPSFLYGKKRIYSCASKLYIIAFKLQHIYIIRKKQTIND